MNDKNKQGGAPVFDPAKIEDEKELKLALGKIKNSFVVLSGKGVSAKVLLRLILPQHWPAADLKRGFLILMYMAQVFRACWGLPGCSLRERKVRSCFLLYIHHP